LRLQRFVGALAAALRLRGRFAGSASSVIAGVASSDSEARLLCGSLRDCDKQQEQKHFNSVPTTARIRCVLTVDMNDRERWSTDGWPRSTAASAAKRRPAVRFSEAQRLHALQCAMQPGEGPHLLAFLGAWRGLAGVLVASRIRGCVLLALPREAPTGG